MNAHATVAPCRSRSVSCCRSGATRRTRRKALGHRIRTPHRPGRRPCHRSQSRLVRHPLTAGSIPTPGRRPSCKSRTSLANGDRPMMTAGKFRSILARVDRKVRLNHKARLTSRSDAGERPGVSLMLPGSMFSTIGFAWHSAFALQSASQGIAPAGRNGRMLLACGKRIWLQGEPRAKVLGRTPVHQI